MKTIIIVLFSLLIYNTVQATTDKYRCIIRDDPATTMTIGWNQINGSNPIVYYDVVDHGTNTASYAYSHSVDRTTSRKGMNNHFSRLTGLSPNTVYYFIIVDNNSNSPRFSFKTSPDVPTERLSFIAGGDSRNNRAARQNANIIVAQTRANAVMFGGDMTNGDSNGEWSDWFDDWQLTTAADGRMTPIIATRGNHEDFNTSVSELFDTPNNDVYYAVTFGGNLYRAYTLNTMISVSGTQKTWLQNDLQSHQHVSWKSAQYHHPMRPHVSSKIERNDMVTHWAPLFENYGMDYVVECDAHTVKSTYPIRTSNAPGNDEGFIRDDINGVVYVGEGCWGAPLRTNDDSKSWTRASGSFNQVKWVFVSEDTIEIRTIKTDNANLVGALTDSNRFAMPSNIDIWNPAPGDDVIYIAKKVGIPKVALYNPLDGQLFMNPQPILLEATAVDTGGSITQVDFYVNGQLVGTDNTAPYNVTWTPTSSGQYAIHARATDNEGKANNSEIATIDVYGSTTTTTALVTQSSDDAEERTSGNLSLTSSDLELVDDTGTGNLNQIIGVRFSSVHVPAGAIITKAYLQFTCDETSSTTTNLTIAIEDTIQANTFSNVSHNISTRTTFGNVAWSAVPAWNTIGIASSNERSSDLSSLIQHLVNKNGWAAVNPMAFVISGSGKRVAESFDGSAAPQLVVEYQNNGVLSGVVDVQIDASSDDAEESFFGTVSLGSSDLELVRDGTNQQVGLRFNQLNIPKGATINSAYLQFTVDETNSTSTALDIFVQDDVNPSTFTSSLNDISSRSKSSTSIAWNPASWTTVGSAGLQQRTPDLSSLIQSIVNQNSWLARNSMVFIITGTGERTAEAFDGDPNKAARLVITYTFNIPTANVPTLAHTGFCPGSTVPLDAGSGFAQYFWGQDISSGQGQQLTVDSAGTYIVRTMDAWGQVTSDTALVTAYATPSLSLGPNQHLNGGTATLNSSSNYASYLWSTGETTASIVVSDTGLYSLMVTDSNGCVNSDTIAVLPAVLAIHLNDNITTEAIKLYPNPAIHHVRLELDHAALETPIQVAIYNQLGQAVFGEVVERDVIKINLSQLESGHYFVRAISDTGETVTKSLLIQK